MTKKYHINPRSGLPGVCSAGVRACPFAEDSAHFESIEAAHAAYEEQMAATVLTSAVKKARVAPSTLTSTDLRSMDEETQRLVLGAVGRVLSHGPKMREAKEYWQAVYDSTEVGQLWLERKNQEGKRQGSPHPEFVERSANVDRFLEEQNANPMATELPTDPGEVLGGEFSTVDPQVYPRLERQGPEAVKLALLSAAWMTVLTPEETEAVSWVTSNGSSVLNAHISGREHSIWGHRVYSEEFLDTTYAHFRNAMAKAPELDDPVVIYRGTSSSRSKWTELDRPASASLSGAIAKGFRGGDEDGSIDRHELPVILEIKTRKLPVAVGMSAWVMGEMEVLAPLGRYQKVREFTTLRGRIGRDGSPALNPNLDEVKVVQMEYLGP